MTGPPAKHFFMGSLPTIAQHTSATTTAGDNTTSLTGRRDYSRIGGHNGARASRSIVI